jgi:hypothetical protein
VRQKFPGCVLDAYRRYSTAAERLFAKYGDHVFHEEVRWAGVVRAASDLAVVHETRRADEIRSDQRC